MPASATPCRPSTIGAALRSWPTLATAASSSTGCAARRQRGAGRSGRPRRRHRTGRRRRGAGRIGGAVAWRQRHVARLARLVENAMPTSVARIGDGASVHDVHARTRPAARHLVDQRVDGRRACRRPRSPCSTDSRRRRELGDQRAERRASRTARSSVARSAPRKRKRVGLERHRHVGANRHQLAALPRLVGVGQQRLALALLRDLAGALPAARRASRRWRSARARPSRRCRARP